MDVTTDEQYLVYSSLDPVVRLVDLATLTSKQEFLNLSARPRTEDDTDEYWFRDNCIMSIKLSSDDKEILAGTKSAKLLVYDMTVG